MSPGEEADLELKLSAMRMLEFMGYFVRRNVLLEPASAGPRRRDQQYTDTDVLGVAISPTYRRSFLVVDCKSGASAGTPERLLWLSGLSRYWGADEGWFARTSVDSSKYADLADRLGVYVTSLSQIRALEELGAEAQSDPASGLTLAYLEKEDAALKLVQTAHPDMYNYMRVRYWQDPPHRQVLLTLRVLEDTGRSAELMPWLKAFWTASCLGQFALSLCGIAREALPINEAARSDAITDLLMGGKSGRDERMNQVRAFHDFMAKEIKDRYGATYPVSKNDFVAQLVPSYTPYLVDLIERLVKDPWAGRFSPHVFEQVSRSLLFGEGQTACPPAIVTLDSRAKSRAVKICADYVTFLTRSKMASVESCTAINNVLSESRWAAATPTTTNT
jgi:hypothetical protein